MTEKQWHEVCPDCGRRHDREVESCFAAGLSVIALYARQKNRIAELERENAELRKARSKRTPSVQFCSACGGTGCLGSPCPVCNADGQQAIMLWNRVCEVEAENAELRKRLGEMSDV